MNSNVLNTYQHLELEHLSSILQKKCQLSINYERLGLLNLYSSIESINNDYTIQKFLNSKYEESQALFTKMSSALADDQGLKSKIKSLKKDAVISINDLYNIARHLDLYKHCKFMKESTLYNEEFSWNSRSYQILSNKFCKVIFQYFDDNHEFQPYNYPPLQKIWQKIQNIEKEIRNSIKSIQSDPIYSEALQFSGHDLINDHYVLSIRSDRYQREHGNIISKSSHGLTLYVEPFAVRDLSHQRVQLIAEFDEILLQLERNFCHFLKEHIVAINYIYNFLVDFDFYFAKVSFGNSYEGNFPEISTDNVVSIRNFHHPLIKDPVKNSIELKREQLGVLISGSNTGGKSVYLKSIALCHLFLKLGLMIPASEARLPLFEAISYFSFDRQNLEEGLSSFSSEVKDYLSLVDSLDTTSSSLIFIDEIFSSTSSKEASALAYSFFNYLNQFRNIKLFVSSHHEELKTSIHQNEDLHILSASVQFDQKLKKPLYLVNYGTPGSSHAVDIFQSLMSPKHISILEMAKDFIGKKAVDYDKIILDLEKKNAELSQLIRTAKDKENLLNQKLGNIAGQMELEKQNIAEHYTVKLQKILDKAFEIQKSLKDGNKLSLRKLSDKSHALKSEFNEVTASNKTQKTSHQFGNSVLIDEVAQGEYYFSRKMNRKICIGAINQKKKMVQVQDKNFKAWLPVDDLTTLNYEQIKSKKKVVVSVHKTTDTSVTLDARGMRLEEFQSSVESRLHDLLIKDIPYLNIIHGHGEGVLKSWLRKHLAKSQDFSWENDKDHDGSTLIKLLD